MKYSNQYNLPSSFVDIVEQLTYDPSTSDPKRVSITTLINPPRIKLLTVRHWVDLEEDVSDHLWRILGNAVHWVLGKVDDTHRLIEEKIEEKIGDITLVGKPDLYDGKEFSISDYKITSVWAVKFELKEEWINQLNMYAWFLRRAGFEVKLAYVNAILRDWRKSESLKYSDYPKIPFQKIIVPLWSIEEQEKFIMERIKEYKIALELADEELPLCTEKERWKKDSVWAIYKNANKTATKLCESKVEAENYILELGKTKDTYRIEERPSTDLRCEQYCLCAPYCNYWIENYKDKK